MPNTKPYVSVACVCEKVLQEKDGVLSAIRLVDTFHLQPLPGAPADAKGILPLTALVALKSGDVTGTFELRMQVRSPSGKVVDIPEKWPVILAGGEQGVQLVMQFHLPVPEFGLYWFDVLWNGDVLTSFPLKLILGPRPAAASADKH